MTYAGGRTILDADSHVMELADFLDDFIEPSQRDRLRRGGMDSLQPVLDDAVAKAASRRSDPAKAALAEERLLTDKGWSAMGGFDPVERSRVLDLLGFDAQLVFATFATSMFTGRDRDRLYAGASAQNRAMANFCRDDPRLLPVGFVPLADPERALACAAEAIDAGCVAVMVPSTAAGDRSPTHPDLDGFWSLLEHSNVPFVLHVGGGGKLLDAATKGKIIDDLREWNDAHRIPILYVTHSREEVFALGDRVVVLDSGRIVAQGTPHEVITAALQETVAQLVGFENIFEAVVESVHTERGTMRCRIMSCRIAGDTGPLVLETPLVRGGVGAALRVGIRAGDILLATAPPVGLSARNVIPGRIASLEQRDVIVTARVKCRVEMEVHLTLAARDSLQLAPGREVWLVIKTHSCHLMQS